MDSTTLAYIAGFTDAEGCFVASKHKDGSYDFAYSVGQIEVEPLELIRKYFGGTISVIRADHRKNRRAMHHLRIGREGAIRIAHRVRPYLRTKRPQADALLEMDYSCVSSRERTLGVIKWHNRVGPSAARYDGAASKAKMGRSLSLGWSPDEQAYHAGFFDGEGCVAYNRQGSHAHLFVSVLQVNPFVLMDIAESFGLSVIKTETRTRPRQRPTHRVTLFGDKAYIYLSLLRPYLLVKQEVVDVFLCSYDWDRPVRLDAVERLRDLNARGIVPLSA